MALPSRSETLSTRTLRPPASRTYDPVHYFNNPDMVAEADRQYAQEAAAYFRLHRRMCMYAEKPQLAPKFYCTWTTCITRDRLVEHFGNKEKDRQASDDESEEDEDVNLPAARPVRIILMEYIEGSAMSDNTKEVDENNDVIVRFPRQFRNIEKRKKIFADVLDSVSWIEHLGITHNKTMPSGFIIRDGNHQVVAIDFAEAEVSEYITIGKTLMESLAKPLNPRWHREATNIFAFAGWVPHEWLAKPAVFVTWVNDTFPSKDKNYVDEEVAEEMAKPMGWEDKLAEAGLIDGKTADEL